MLWRVHENHYENLIKHVFSLFKHSEQPASSLPSSLPARRGRNSDFTTEWVKVLSFHSCPGRLPSPLNSAAKFCSFTQVLHRDPGWQCSLIQGSTANWPGAGGDSGISKVAFNSLYKQPLPTSLVSPALAGPMSSMAGLYQPASCSLDLPHVPPLQPFSSFPSAQDLNSVISALKEAPPFN